MLKKVIFTILVIFNLLFLTYLSLPTPTLKDLPSSAKSDEPGDTVQLKNVAGYYTNLSRTEVMNFYRATYTSPLLIRLNHPPEFAKTIFRDTMQSYYLEEFHLPLKESLYINGFEWENDVFTKPEKRITNKLIFKGKEYRSKITIRTIPTPLSSRLIVFFGTETALFSLFYLYRKFLRKI